MATVKYLADIDLSQNGLNNARIQNLGTPPNVGTEVEGEIYYDTVTNSLKVWNSTTWVQLGADGDITSIVAGTGLTGSSLTSGAATLNVIGGNGITASADEILLTNGLIADGSNITSVGTIGTGIWQGTTIKTAYIGDNQVTEDKLADTLLAEIDANTDKITNVSTNLGITGSTAARTITSSDGTNAVIPLATTSVSGLLSPALFDEIDANTAKATNVTTNLSVASSTGARVIASSDGTNATIPIATTSVSGVMSTAIFDAVAANTAKVTNTDVDVSVANLKTRLAGGFGSNAVTIGDSSDVVTVGGALTVTGNLIVNGTATTVNTATLEVQDPLIRLAGGNESDSVDIGFFGRYVASSEERWTGLFRDASDSSNAWTFFNTPAMPETTVATGESGYELGIAKAEKFIGGLDGNASTATTLQSTRTIGGVSFNGAANINLPGVNIAGNQNTSGLAGTATALATARAINGEDFDGTAAITVTAAAGTLTGNTLKSTVVTSSLTSVGTIGTGVWNATEIGTSKTAAKVTSIVAGAGIDVNNSGVGDVTVTAETASVTNPGIVELATTGEALAGADTTRAVTAAGLAARSYREAIGGATAIAVTHSLGTKDVMVQMYDASSFETVIAQVVRNTTAQVTVTFNTAPSAGDIIILVTKID